jgi:CBS domain-containing protein
MREIAGRNGMRASDIMTRKVVSTSSEASVGAAVRLMLDHEISGLPVVDGEGRLVGIVTEGDFLRRAETGTERHRGRLLSFLLGPGALAADYVQSHARHVAEIMTRDVATIEETTSLDEIVTLMERRHVKRLPVLRDGKPVGIVSRANLLRALAGLVARPAAASNDDAALTRVLAAALAQERWAPRGAVGVEVRGGIAHLTGVVLDEKQRTALHVAAENIPGIKGVADEVMWIEPFSGIAVDPER